jgi:uncharacterized membrane protein YhaH (DUF805 family)
MMNYYFEVLKKYAVFKGRARRSEYWYFFLFNIIASILLGIIDYSVGTYNEELGSGLFETIYSLGIIIPSIAVGVRRMHDVGKSGWFLLIPIYNLILAITEGDAGENEYGPDPKNPYVDDISDHLVE